MSVRSGAHLPSDLHQRARTAPLFDRRMRSVPMGCGHHIGVCHYMRPLHCLRRCHGMRPPPDGMRIVEFGGARAEEENDWVDGDGMSLEVLGSIAHRPGKAKRGGGREQCPAVGARTGGSLGLRRPISGRPMLKRTPRLWCAPGAGKPMSVPPPPEPLVRRAHWPWRLQWLRRPHGFRRVAPVGAAVRAGGPARLRLPNPDLEQEDVSMSSVSADMLWRRSLHREDWRLQSGLSLESCHLPSATRSPQKARMYGPQRPYEVRRACRDPVGCVDLTFCGDPIDGGDPARCCDPVGGSDPELGCDPVVDGDALVGNDLVGGGLADYGAPTGGGDPMRSGDPIGGGGA